ncbi:MAG TPA: imidazole glycerol phosphate synthase subunit HisH [Bacteroidales bacterium]|nr:imidazole glycerol phosphate synthase subunit HisH [Bacteroidales bacterium]
MICIIDYGLGNLGSIFNMLRYAEIPSVISSEKSVISAASHLILPGVGSFDTGMDNINKRDLRVILDIEVLEKKKPVLGLCLGAQLMLESSAEGEHRGLGWLKGSCVRFSSSNGIKVPHMGWNTIDISGEPELFRNMPSYSPRFYFVHTYYFSLSEARQVIGQTEYGMKFSSAFRSDNIFGVQFHPEKSHKFGLQLLKNFYSI